jgi:ribonuclease R
LGDDYFRFNEARRAMIGDATGETLTLGDRVTVRLAEAVPLAGALRFELLSDRKSDGGAKRGRAQRYRREDRGRRPAPRPHRGQRRR